MEKEKVIILKGNNLEIYQKMQLQFEQTLEESKKLWYGLIRLLITLSSTMLLASISFADKISSFAEASPLVKNTLLASWALFFTSMVFCVIAELMGADHHARRGVKFANEMKKILLDLNQGKTEKETKIKVNDSFIEYPSLMWGLIGVLSFLHAVVNTSIYLASRYFSINIWIVLFVNGVVLLFLSLLICDHYKYRGTKIEQ